MGIVKIAEGAFFVKSYSEQTIAPAYRTDITINSYGTTEIIEDSPLEVAPVKSQPVDLQA